MKEESNSHSVTFRLATTDDYPTIQELTCNAFHGRGEADLITSLREAKCFQPNLSLVGVINECVVAHCLFSNVELIHDSGVLTGLALAPVSVDPAHQRRCIGTRLVEYALSIAARAGYTVVLVLGHVAFYSRFGFSVELGRHVRCDYSGDNFMAAELVAGSLTTLLNVRAKYPSPFHDL